jgi:hypothetical protein
MCGVLRVEGFFVAGDAFARISKARGLQVPDTPEQVRWIEEFAARWCRIRFAFFCESCGVP